VFGLPLTVLRLVRGSAVGGLQRRGPGGRVVADRGGAGQAAAAGGPQAASKRFSHACSRCQPSGRWLRWRAC